MIVKVLMWIYGRTAVIYEKRLCLEYKDMDVTRNVWIQRYVCVYVYSR